MSLVGAALQFANDGYEVFPVNEHTKAPYTPNGMKDASGDETLIMRWWHDHPAALIGCRIAEDLVVLDIDPRHAGHKVWDELQRAYAPIVPGRRHHSGRGDGGHHDWFLHPGGKLSTRKLSEWARRNGVGVPAGKRSWSSGIDILHHGHRYTILPPSPHPATGAPYEWDDRGAPGPMPGLLVDLLRPVLEEVPQREPQTMNGDSIADWFSDSHSWHDILPPAGWVPVDGNGDDDGSTWRHPNASAATSASVRHGCLFVYSDNTDFPVTEDGDPRGVTKFRAWATLEHDGDLSMAASAARIAKDGPPRVVPPVTNVTPPASSRVRDGATFILDESADLEPRWGQGSQVLWARGESLVVAAPPGVGKTTLAGQLVAGLLGIQPAVLGLPVEPAERVLYLAMDRPSQIRRSLRRRFGEEHRQALAERLIVWPGPLTEDLGRHPGILIALALEHGADVVVMDSLKDAAVKLVDDEVGGNVNRAIQHCNAQGVDVAILHHQRKGERGEKPTTLSDVYGSTWITAGAGSVILLWGEAGSELVELSHLKQPGDPVGPWRIEHDHHVGMSVVTYAFDALAFLRMRGDDGATIAEVAHAEHQRIVSTGSPKWKQTERRLRALVREGLAAATGQPAPGVPGHFRAVDTPRGQGLSFHPLDTSATTVDTNGETPGQNVDASVDTRGHASPWTPAGGLYPPAGTGIAADDDPRRM
jgi:hypothetical protein